MYAATCENLASVIRECLAMGDDVYYMMEMAFAVNEWCAADGTRFPFEKALVPHSPDSLLARTLRRLVRADPTAENCLSLLVEFSGANGEHRNRVLSLFPFSETVTIEVVACKYAALHSVNESVLRCILSSCDNDLLNRELANKPYLLATIRRHSRLT